MTHVEFAKWGGRRHWTYEAVHLGEDEHGIWLGGPTGTVLDRPDVRLVLDFPSAVLVPRGRPWVAAINADAPIGVRADYEIYIDISSVPVWEGDTMRAYDLDLDVVRGWDGTIEVLDEDEFADHQVRLGYPTALVAQAEAGRDECLALLQSAAEPFVRTCRDWLAQISADPERRPAS